MVTLDNLGRKLHGVLQSQSPKGEAKEWKLLGQEQDGSLLVNWLMESVDENERPEVQSFIGLYHQKKSSLKVLCTFNKYVNTIQASINHSQSLLGFVTKEKCSTTPDSEASNGKTNNSLLDMVYKVFILDIRLSEENREPQNLGLERSHQIMIQFLYRKKEQAATEKFLLFIHQESISLNQVHLREDGSYELESSGCLNTESMVRAFSWAQWDPINQSLYYIHYRKPQLSVEGEEPEEGREEELSPTLSCLQFHDDMPHETVLNIPLNLPQLPKTSSVPCGGYEDDPIPLRVHDCSLDLQVVCDPKGIVCICHHYLYQPVKPPITETRNLEESSNTVHFAYSVTLLHHGCVIHCVVPGILWSQARTMKPTFALYGDQHMVVYAPDLFTHLLDIGLAHEPCCHVLMSCTLPGIPSHTSHLVPLLQYSNTVTVDLPTLDLIQLTVTTGHLVETFKSDHSLENQLAILHYFLVHQGDLETVSELLMYVAEHPVELSVPQLLQEVIIGGAYASAQRNLPSDAMSLVALLPLSTITHVSELEVRVNRQSMSLTQETLWNTAMMLLSPQQRLVPYRVDMWTRLWDQLAKRTGKEQKPRFRPSLVADKLMVSLVCYQPEALSRSSTPLSPGTTLVGSGTLADLAAISGTRKGPGIDVLPFYEVESCTASKQEHVISVNLRELSMHLLKNSSKQSPMHVHVVATRYVAAQLEMSKQLCQLLCQCAAVDPHQEQERGFALIDQLDEERRYVLFTLLERFYFAVDSMAFPLPQGFTSFFTYLGYRTLSFSMFLQYLQRNVFELQVDVMKIIMADTEDTREGVKKKLRLLLFLPRSRAKRLLNQWSHPVSLMIRAREHALNILSGVEGTQARVHLSQKARTTHVSTRGLAAFPSADRLSPLDTFLDLLTAKASLAELDFGLLIEATVTSTEEFLE
ncbi:protein pigeon isoform X1 [Periplaneta americana]|uniref:protein pigeon isoform X1 n=2 Tax=Periplaneta americana TaxID=6978 RepID=UPI0037E93AC3